MDCGIAWFLSGAGDFRRVVQGAGDAGGADSGDANCETDDEFAAERKFADRLAAEWHNFEWSDDDSGPGGAAAGGASQCGIAGAWGRCA